MRKSVEAKRNKVTHSGGGIQEWLSSIFFAAIAAAAIRWLLIGVYMIPSGSMESTLLPGDYVIISKFHYGARTPNTPLQLPLTHRTIPGTKIPSYLDWIELPTYRLPGISEIKRNDIIVFNTPIGTDPPDLSEYWIKRCVALPGDTLHIDHKQLYVNDVLTDTCNTIQYCYFMKTKRTLDEAFFERNNIKYSDALKEGYRIFITPQKAQELTSKLLPYIPSVEPIEESIPGLFSPEIYPFHPTFNWNKDNFGPLKIPHKGMTIQLNEKNIILYGPTILRHEGKKDIQFYQDSCWINNQRIEQYTFCKDYYFVMGDNRDRSQDSRFIGFIPKDYIVGKAIMVLFSSNPTKCFFKGVRWNRLFHMIT